MVVLVSDLISLCGLLLCRRGHQVDVSRVAEALAGGGVAFVLAGVFSLSFVVACLAGGGLSSAWWLRLWRCRGRAPRCRGSSLFLRAEDKNKRVSYYKILRYHRSGKGSSPRVINPALSEIKPIRGPGGLVRRRRKVNVIEARFACAQRTASLQGWC